MSQNVTRLFGVRTLLSSHVRDQVIFPWSLKNFHPYLQEFGG